MTKLDLKKTRKQLYTAPLNRFVEIDAPPASYLMVDGSGEPNTVPGYGLAVEALFATAYTIKFACKSSGKDFVVPLLEGLWSAPDPASLRLETLEEGLCLQALHVGSYDDEGPLLAKLHAEIMPAGGYDFAGRHHEVYLSDPRRVPPERLKTVIRQPVRRD